MADALDLGSSPSRGGGSNPPFRRKLNFRRLIEMKSEIKSSDGLAREIEIEIDAATVDAAFSSAYKKYTKQAKIKGFRPGKAPLNIIKSTYGEAIRDDVAEELIRNSYPEAIKEHDLKVASYRDISGEELSEGSPFKYTAKVEVLPEIETINYDGLTLPEDDLEVRDSEVDTVVEFLRKKQADIRPVDRAIEKEDIIKIDIEKTADEDKVLKGDKFDDVEIDLSSDLTVTEFKEHLPGLKLGEEKEIEVKYPVDYNNKTLAGKSIKYLCKVKEVKERILPELTDAFAVRVDENIATMLELKLRIREDLEKQKKFDQEKWKSNQVQRQFLDNNQIDVPDSMVENYLDSMMEEFKKQKQEVDENSREQYRPTAVNGIRWSLLTNKIIADEKIEVLPEDTEKWIKRFADNYNMDMEKAKEVLSGTGRIREIRDSIIDEKIIEFLLSKAKYIPQKDWAQEGSFTEAK